MRLPCRRARGAGTCSSRARAASEKSPRTRVPVQLRVPSESPPSRGSRPARRRRRRRAGTTSSAAAAARIRDPGRPHRRRRARPRIRRSPRARPRAGWRRSPPWARGWPCRLRRRRRRAAVRAARASPRHRQARPPCPRAPEWASSRSRAPRGPSAPLRRRRGASPPPWRRPRPSRNPRPRFRPPAWPIRRASWRRRRRRLWRRARARQRCSPSSPCSARRAPRARPGRGRRTCPPAQRTHRSPPGCAPGSPPPNPSDPPRPPVPARRPPPTSSTAPAARCAGGGATWTPPGA